MKAKRKTIDWKKQRERERFYLRHGRFPRPGELEASKGKPVLLFGYNTAK